MKLHYHPETDSLYIEFSEDPGVETREVSDCVSDMRTSGELVPEPMADRRYSGKFMVRVPPETHRTLAIRAAEQGVSMNRLVSARLAKDC